MIISNEHRYLFIQLPHTASTAIGRELVELYDGKPMLHKHAMYHHARRELGESIKDYFVFSSVRNPMDELVSVYHKFKTNHNQLYSNPSNWKHNGGWLSSRGLRQFRYVYYNDATFQQYFRKFFRLPYANMSVLWHDRLDFVIRYEHLQNDFYTVLDRLGLKQKRPLPLVNPTQKGTSSADDYYSEDLKDHAAFVLSPLMLELGYELPEDWSDAPTLGSRVSFFLVRTIRRLFWRYLT